MVATTIVSLSERFRVPFYVVYCSSLREWQDLIVRRGGGGCVGDEVRRWVGGLEEAAAAVGGAGEWNPEIEERRVTGGTKDQIGTGW